MGMPRGREVDRALTNSVKEVKASLKELNQNAGKLLAKGRYEQAEALVSQGRIISEFQGKVDALRTEWRSLRKGGGTSVGSGETTPLWQYYKPILKSLISLGGEASRKDIQKDFEASHLSDLKPDDTGVMARGRPRWTVMIQRSRRPLIKEGFIENSSAKAWKITAEGRKAAEGKA